MKIKFTKMTGAGNDFIIIDDRKNQFIKPNNIAKKLCNRRFGIGADGLILLRKSLKFEYLMMYFNSDGSYGGMCGNGGRCIAKYAFIKGIADKQHVFEALGFGYRALVNKGDVKLHMKKPSIIIKKRFLLNKHHIKSYFINTGAPHIVIPLSLNKSLKINEIDKIDVEVLGKRIRFHKTFKPEGTNVNFLELINKNTIKMRTYERGVEAETLACGTGAIATALVAEKIWKINQPTNIFTRSNKILKVDFKKEKDEVFDIWLRGPAEIVFEGSIEI
jgi:diaminopimelate epimerase